MVPNFLRNCKIEIYPPRATAHQSQPSTPNFSPTHRKASSELLEDCFFGFGDDGPAAAPAPKFLYQRHVQGNQHLRASHFCSYVGRGKKLQQIGFKVIERYLFNGRGLWEATVGFCIILG
ncbi:hypothetical protein TWF225_004017 [Orbilia oligospora]|uniref:Uncharacterized protein n=1 Tax=Orbilia oligospora TaxID=2813651 RepID=A0A7C8KFE3_ORBOL|nr:hypothetical protein TWF751_004755 [Orbilia oligospora]KAF3187780.1 hypothetical protein TWF225_004017 [Orbilia oligospora]KAF3251254.1 hypothetical protein TWF128_007262 [Orbilia oligospora]KAF3256188.1 hypothetical protein TWF217_006436 [Orbilia oligospora]KAF3286438.1 hypothetical protein TWF132_008866 [Orbilia oligospora]